MIGVRQAIGNRPHRIALEKDGPSVPDGDGGYTPSGTVPLDPPQVDASVEPAAARDLEYLTSGTVAASATHVIRMPYHPQVDIHTRVRFKGRTFNIAGIANREERNADLVLFCKELLS